MLRLVTGHTIAACVLVRIADASFLPVHTTALCVSIEMNLDTCQIVA